MAEEQPLAAAQGKRTGIRGGMAMDGRCDAGCSSLASDGGSKSEGAKTELVRAPASAEKSSNRARVAKTPTSSSTIFLPGS